MGKGIRLEREVIRAEREVAEQLPRGGEGIDQVGFECGVAGDHQCLRGFDRQQRHIKATREVVAALGACRDTRGLGASRQTRLDDGGLQGRDKPARDQERVKARIGIDDEAVGIHESCRLCRSADLRARPRGSVPVTLRL